MIVTCWVRGNSQESNATVLEKPPAARVPRAALHGMMGAGADECRMDKVEHFDPLRIVNTVSILPQLWLTLLHHRTVPL